MTEDWLEALLGKPDEMWKLAKLKEEHPYVADLIGLLLPYRNNGMRRSMILHTLEKERKNAGLPIPPTFEQSVQSAYNGALFPIRLPSDVQNWKHYSIRPKARALANGRSMPNEPRLGLKNA